MPLQIEGVVENFLMVNESDEILLAQKTDSSGEGILIGTENVGNLFSISDELISNINTSSINNSLGSDYTIFNDGDVLLFEEKNDLIGPIVVTDILVLQDEYLKKRAAKYGADWGLDEDEIELLGDEFVNCKYPIKSWWDIFPMPVLTDNGCVITNIADWPGVPGNHCQMAAALPSLINWGIGIFWDRPLTPDEITLINLHCACGFIVLKNGIKAWRIAGFEYPGAITRNNCQDAFRHTYWNALNATSIPCIGLVQSFSDAHEQGQPVNNNSRMDLWNNDAGRIIGLNSGFFTLAAPMISIVKNELEMNGVGKILSSVPQCPIPGVPGATFNCDTNMMISSTNCP